MSVPPSTTTRRRTFPWTLFWITLGVTGFMVGCILLKAKLRLSHARTEMGTTEPRRQVRFNATARARVIHSDGRMDQHSQVLPVN